MPNQSSFPRVLDVFKKWSGASGEGFSLNSRLIDDVATTYSLYVEFLGEIEKEFGIRFSPRERQDLSEMTVQVLVNILDGFLATQTTDR